MCFLEVNFLPQLAAFFNITVDELINYNPQMIRDDILKLYYKFSDDFTKKPFDDIMKIIRQEIIDGVVKNPALLKSAVLLTMLIISS